MHGGEEYHPLFDRVIRIGEAPPVAEIANAFAV
jgi:hypothetical protein